MKLAYESERAMLRIYESADGATVHEVRAHRALFRQVVTAREIAVDPDGVRALAMAALDALIAEDFGGEPFGEVEVHTMSESPAEAGNGVHFDVIRRSTGSNVMQGVIVLDYYRCYWPEPPADVQITITADSDPEKVGADISRRLSEISGANA
jgi:hypothetical protein